MNKSRPFLCLTGLAVLVGLVSWSAAAAGPVTVARPRPLLAVAFVTATPLPDGSIVHIVAEGETVWTIAAQYGITVDELYANNELGDFIYEGQAIVIRPAQPTPEPSATPTPTTEPTPAGDAAGGGPEIPEPVQEPSPPAVSVICVTAFQDLNANGVRDAGENLLGGVVFSVYAGQQVIGSYTSDGISEPYCFQGLFPRDYRLTQATVAGWAPTTVSDWSLSLQAGQVFNVEFGSVRLEPAATPVSAADDSPLATSDEPTTWNRVLTSVGAGLGVFGLLLILGAGLFVILSRRTDGRLV